MHGCKHMHKVEVYSGPWTSGASWLPNCIILFESLWLLAAAAFVRAKKKCG